MLASFALASLCLSAANQEGTLIAFVSDRDGNQEIYSMNADGSGVKRLTRNPGRDVEPVWSPDGTKIAWASNRTGDWEIFVMNATDGSEVYNITTTKERDDTSPMWWAKHDLVRFVSKKRFYTSDADGDRPRQLTDYPLPADCQPSLSPDGLKVAFRGMDGALMIMEGWHSAMRVPIQYGSAGVPKKAANPAWGHDGAIIAFDSGDAQPFLYTIDLESSIVEKVVFKGFGFDPAFLVQSDSLVFTNPTGVGKGSDICSIDLDAVHRSQGPPDPVNLTKSAGNDGQAAVWQPKE